MITFEDVCESKPTRSFPLISLIPKWKRIAFSFVPILRLTNSVRKPRVQKEVSSRLNVRKASSEKNRGRESDAGGQKTKQRRAERKQVVGQRERRGYNSLGCDDPRWNLGSGRSLLLCFGGKCFLLRLLRRFRIPLPLALNCGISCVWRRREG